MGKDQLFVAIVELYKSLKNQLEFSSGIISSDCKVIINARQAEILKLIYDNKSEFRTLNIEIDYSEIVSSNQIVDGVEFTNIKISLPSGMFFFKNTAELLDSNSSFLFQGSQLPSLFYLTDIDYISTNSLKLPNLEKIKPVLEWVDFLKKIADIEKKTDSGISLYFFIKSGDDKFSKPLEIVFSNIVKICTLEKISSVDDVKFLIQESDLGNLYSKDKQAFFKLALVETLKSAGIAEVKPQEHALLLFKNLDNVKSNYYEHYEIFIHNFAIGEFQQQVQDKWFDYSEKISSVLNDIKTKLYSVPIALVSLGTLTALTDAYSYYFIIIGVLVTGWINHLMVKEQDERLSQISSSSNFIFEKLVKKSKESTEPPETFIVLDEVVEKINKRVESGHVQIKNYKYFCWLPTIVMFILFFAKERNQIIEFLSIDLSCIYCEIFKVIWKLLIIAFYVIMGVC